MNELNTNICSTNSTTTSLPREPTAAERWGLATFGRCRCIRSEITSELASELLPKIRMIMCFGPGNWVSSQGIHRVYPRLNWLMDSLSLGSLFSPLHCKSEDIDRIFKKNFKINSCNKPSMEEYLKIKDFFSAVKEYIQEETKSCPVDIYLDQIIDDLYEEVQPSEDTQYLTELRQKGVWLIPDRLQFDEVLKLYNNDGPCKGDEQLLRVMLKLFIKRMYLPENLNEEIKQAGIEKLLVLCKKISQFQSEPEPGNEYSGANYYEVLNTRFVRDNFIKGIKE